MRRLWLGVLPLSLMVVAACIGDDPGAPIGGANDGGGASVDGAAANADGGATGDDGGGNGSTDASATEDAEAGAVLCGYPGEACCAAPALPCKSGTVCGTSNQRCMVSELGVVGTYTEIRDTAFAQHTASAFYDGKDWSMGPDVIGPQAPLSSKFSPTDLISGGLGSYHVTLFKGTEGKMQNFSANLWRKCEPGQACAGPTLPPPAFWSVAKISNETWIGATNAIYRCSPGASCAKEVAGLESTTWGTGKLVGTSVQDVWFSALTRAFHFDGTKWTIHDGIKARTIFQLRKDDVWVGDKTLQHWDGTAWSDELAIDGAPAPGIITSISGSSSADVWAVGYDGSTGDHPAFAAHWDGTAWTMRPLPAGAREAPSVYAPSPLEAFVACRSGVYRWNGTEWNAMTFPGIDAGTGGQPTWDVVTGPARPRP